MRASLLVKGEGLEDIKRVRVSVRERERGGGLAVGR